MMSLSRLFALAFLLLPPAAAQDFWVAGALRDGKAVAGTVAESGASLEVTTPAGESVVLRIARNPGWTSAETVLDVAWSEERQRYILRALNWTGEARRLRGALSVTGEDRRPVLVPLDGVSRLVISHARKQ